MNCCQKKDLSPRGLYCYEIATQRLVYFIPEGEPEPPIEAGQTRSFPHPMTAAEIGAR